MKPRARRLQGIRALFALHNFRVFHSVLGAVLPELPCSVQNCSLMINVPRQFTMSGVGFANPAQLVT